VRVLFLTTDFESGGAGIAASRIAKSLTELGHQVQIESLELSSGSSFFKKKRKFLAKANRIFEYKALRIARYGHESYLATTFLPFNALGRLNLKDFDIVHIHWVNYGFLSLREIRLISQKIPTVWTLHSYWPFTAPFQYAGNEVTLNQMENFLTKRFLVDITSYRFHSLRTRIKWIAPSDHLWKDIEIPLGNRATIANPLPKNMLVLPKKPERYLFIGAGDVFDKRKGLVDLLIAWVSSYDKKNPRRLTIIGPTWEHSQTKFSGLLKFAQSSGVDFFGHVQDPRVMSLLHQEAHGLFVPSYEETFGQVISEALANGTRVIARDSLSCLSAFRDFHQGILKIAFDDDGMEKAFSWCERQDPLQQEFIQKVQDTFSANKIAERVLNLYEQSIKEFK
jgi:glycosyltransferase involved in cell wall biosynthesis